MAPTTFALTSLLPDTLPPAVTYFILFMVALNLSAVVLWSVCLCREARAPKPAKVRVRKAE